MGGAAKGVAKTIGRVGSGVFTLGGSEIARNNLRKSHVINKVLQTPGMILTGGQSGGWGNGDVMQGTGTAGDPFAIDPAQIAADQAAITGLGDQQFAETNAFNTGDQAGREAARQRLSDSLIRQNQDVFRQGMAGTLEDLNSRNLANGSGVGQEFARQQGDIATNIANQVGVQGANDINRFSDVGLGALQAKQGMGQSALSRGFSLEDFVRQANVAKSIGATAAPQVPSGKASGLSGGLSGAAAGAPFGPWGAALGGAGGLLLGSQANKQGK